MVPAVVTAAICAVNLLIGVAFFASRWWPRPVNTPIALLLEAVLGVVYVAGFVAAGVASLRGVGVRTALRVGIAGVSAWVMVGLIELVFSSFPALLPDAVLVRNAALLMKAHRMDEQDVIEHVPESPWVKFRPGMQVRSPGIRGQDFSYEWTTDRLGFKNDPRVAALERVTALAVGDSFGEAMGVPVAAQWTTLVTEAGFPVYNLSVQGYAPVQMVGALRKYGAEFEADLVLFGFTPGSEGRNRIFKDPAALRARRYTGAIEQVNRHVDEIRRVEYRVFPVTNAVLSGGEQALRGLRLGLTLRLDLATEIEAASRAPFDEASSDWQETLAAIREARTLSQQRGAKLAVLLFSNRAIAYHERFTGAPPPPGHYESRVREALARTCRAERISLIDTHDAFRQYVDRVWGTSEPPPFFEIDGHPSAAGQRLIAREVVGYLERQGMARRAPARASIER